MEKTGSVTRVKDHLACIPNKDTRPCANVSADVKASLETWRRTRLGLGMHEESSQHGGDEIDVCEASHVGTSKRSASGSVSGPTPSAKRTPLPSSSAPKAQVEAEPEASSSSSQSEEQPSDDEMEHASSDDA
ncbi:hypothetical protein L7F22_004644 [Adiantum nelumboides]|nr:hypothetical protein [Adiantum nelumboides]